MLNTVPPNSNSNSNNSESIGRSSSEWRPRSGSIDHSVVLLLENGPIEESPLHNTISIPGPAVCNRRGIHDGPQYEPPPPAEERGAADGFVALQDDDCWLQSDSMRCSTQTHSIGADSASVTMFLDDDDGAHALYYNTDILAEDDARKLIDALNRAINIVNEVVILEDDPR